MDAIISQLFNGLSLGSIWLMVSLGLAFAFGLVPLGVASRSDPARVVRHRPPGGWRR